MSFLLQIFFKLKKKKNHQVRPVVELPVVQLYQGPCRCTPMGPASLKRSYLHLTACLCGALRMTSPTAPEADCFQSALTMKVASSRKLFSPTNVKRC
ncbi:hypothetical protein XELAEV_18019432mg [Xenopus laevis]|uniref:Uncharacterized protein n=1 Tax=Xenopus laevis TaxID=8355 RepID=A0A974HUK8_XENLA|nr:hypothetical protein XELAEV_18019432mg [Xenopus laevis]